MAWGKTHGLLAKAWFRARRRILRFSSVMKCYHKFSRSCKKATIFNVDLFQRLNKEAMGTKMYETELYRQYHKFLETSIDYGLLEKLPSDAFVTLEADMGWEDVGISWETFYRSLVTSTLKDDTVEEGGADTQYLDAERNLVIGPKRKMIGIVGVSDIAVIDTSDGLLICKLSESQKVKALYENIEKEKAEYVE